jgi:class 3 adenylate cyclase
MTSPDTPPYPPSGKKGFPFSRPLFLEFSAIIVLLILIIFISLTLFFIKHQREALYQEKVSSGEMLLGQLANRAALPLLENDTLNLQSLIKEMKGATGVVYAVIVDDKKIIRAHTDPAKVGSRLETPPETLPPGKRVLSLSKTVTFMSQNVGSVVLRLSIDSIDYSIKKERLSFIKKAAPFCFMAMLMGVGVAFLFSRWAYPPVPTTRLRPGLPDNSLRMNEKDSPLTRTQVAILSAGIKEFKAYAESRDPQELLKNLKEYLTIATDGIIEYGGSIDRITGDAVVGVFRNSPFQKNHTIRAIRCAMSIRKTFEQASQKGNQLLIMAGFGISSGVVASRPLLSHESGETAFIGESFKEASSLNMMAGPGEIIISKDVYQSIENLVSIEPLPPRERTQRTESWENFRLLHITERKEGGVDRP